MSRLALVAGSGRLPALIAGALGGDDFVLAEMDGFPSGLDRAAERFRY